MTILNKQIYFYLHEILLKIHAKLSRLIALFGSKARQKVHFMTHYE